MGDTRNLTLAIEDDVLLQARKVALDRKTTVNQLVRDFLSGLVDQESRRDAARRRLRRFMSEKKVNVGKARWTREDLYERR